MASFFGGFFKEFSRIILLNFAQTLKVLKDLCFDSDNFVEELFRMFCPFGEINSNNNKVPNLTKSQITL
ncbi:hypothetical protein A9G24_12035 [Gilliamella sp. App6-5]|nr:hypothetical protein A9G24_12035 [Gilliamella apicola]